jgi:hypothetical protein
MKPVEEKTCFWNFFNNSKIEDHDRCLDQKKIMGPMGQIDKKSEAKFATGISKAVLDAAGLNKKEFVGNTNSKKKKIIIAVVAAITAVIIILYSFGISKKNLQPLIPRMAKKFLKKAGDAFSAYDGDEGDAGDAGGAGSAARLIGTLAKAARYVPTEMFSFNSREIDVVSAGVIYCVSAALDSVVNQGDQDAPGVPNDNKLQVGQTELEKISLFTFRKLNRLLLDTNSDKSYLLTRVLYYIISKNQDTVKNPATAKLPAGVNVVWDPTTGSWQVSIAGNTDAWVGVDQRHEPTQMVNPLTQDTRSTQDVNLATQDVRILPELMILQGVNAGLQTFQGVNAGLQTFQAGGIQISNSSVNRYIQQILKTFLIKIAGLIDTLKKDDMVPPSGAIIELTKILIDILAKLDETYDIKKFLKIIKDIKLIKNILLKLIESGIPKIQDTVDAILDIVGLSLIVEG